MSAGAEAVRPEECCHSRDYRTYNEDGTQDCVCGAIIATDGKTVWLPQVDGSYRKKGEA